MPSDQIAAILVVDDEPDLRTLYELTLLREGHDLTCAADLQEARACLAQRNFDVLITDMRLPDGLGLELLREISGQQRRETCIVITAYGSAENAVEALKSGAFDYLTKPVDLKQLRGAVAAALQSQRQVSGGLTATQPTRAPGVPLAPAPPPSGVQALARIVGASPAMEQIRHRIEKVSSSMAPVLILGESGTGKELVARAVHDCSHRSTGPFVAVNCGAIPDNLIEAEFFGARKGAYTGASQDREGYFQAAKGGTLFLDEIGDLPLAMQAKLLRVIQERRVRPLGGVQEENVDVRLVSATHRDLAALVKSGDFRQDLFYRLNVIGLRTPPLRERREDLPLLARVLLERICNESGHPAPHLSPQAMDWLQNCELAGNVRELENLLQRALALSTGPNLEPSDFADPSDPPPEATPDRPATSDDAPDATTEAPPDIPSDLQSFLDDQERQVLLKALKETDFNRTAAAARLGLNLRQMRYRIQRLGIEAPTPDGDPF
ncbi:sigma-54 dependent transcriptional regulator [Hydrogenophaga sp. PAMC20947]|uniref:sigma-54-dependent transcriptional regulator n=1 Tax=Hydrogenophaga sp. PAMC20947 TaxID=2565558 RepID=UPI00109DC765|nr:sigma-54 dependent transcriptional regulator [Hydrogenophaga sp. PAMC20947]QCB48216.1 sigma-54-dependent Fis family transcriptional regulator [Hydrogenophaga sp. PAMC20947]